MMEDTQTFTLIFTLCNEIGSLDGVLKTLRDNNVSMSHIESRPSKTFQWDYDFFIQFNSTHAIVDSLVVKLQKVKDVKDIRVVSVSPVKSKSGSSMQINLQ